MDEVEYYEFPYNIRHGVLCSNWPVSFSCSLRANILINLKNVRSADLGDGLGVKMESISIAPCRFRAIPVVRQQPLPRGMPAVQLMWTQLNGHQPEARAPLQEPHSV